MNKDVDGLYKAREKRIADAIELRVPDRVPVTASFYFFPARYYGFTAKDAIYDGDKLLDMQLRATVEFEPDLAQNPFFLVSVGPMFDLLDFRLYAWPGRQLGPDVPFQFVEGEYMEADEYDHFFSDPMDFVVRKYWPRISGSLQGLGALPSFRNYTDYMSLGIFGVFSLPEVQVALDTLRAAGREAERLGAFSRRLDEKLREAGFPIQGRGLAQAPFDLLGDYLRGTKGLMLDMYRRPDKVMKACEKLLPLVIQTGVHTARRTRSTLVFIALHKGLDGFMSLEQFKRFYWPTLRELMLALINQGLTPYVFWEGDCTSRLETIGDIPAGKALYRFEATDMIKAKDALRDRVCIRGNVPVSILATGTADEVRSYCRKLIDYAGKDGGFIMDASAHVSDARPENLRAMFEFTKEYGVY
jgi:hypothetical protein